MNLFMEWLNPHGWPLAVVALCLFVGVGCGASPEVKASTQSDELALDMRPGVPPSVPPEVPHQQLDQNSSPEVLEDLRSFVFGLEHVEEGQTQTSLPSARGAFINSNVRVNSAINREFTHIHMVPGPGSQHLVLTDEHAARTIESGWGVKHPWSDRLSQRGMTLLMIYAPRDQKDLEQIEKIVTAAWQLALSDG